MSQFAREDRRGAIDFVSDSDIILESDRDQDGVGDLVFRTAGVERARIAHDGTGTGWSNVLGGSSPAPTTFAPSVTPLTPTTTDGGSNVVLWMSADGSTLYGGNSTAVSYSTDDGTTWTSNSFTFPQAVLGVRGLADGEILVSVYTATNAGKLYKSSGWASDKATATFTLVKTASAADNYFASTWSISISGSHVVANEYGTKAGGGTQARYSYYSSDSGATWTTIFDLVTTEIDGAAVGDVSGTHLHGACYDGYWDRIWMSFGDTQSVGKVFYSDDHGATWKWAKVVNQDANHGQVTTIFALKNSVIFSGDQPPGGVRTFARNLNDDKTLTPVIFDSYSIDAIDQQRWLGQGAFQAAGTNQPVLLGFQPDQSASIYQPSVIVATVDGFTFYEIWRDSIGYANQGADRPIVGPTSAGNIVWSNKDGRQTNRSLNVATAPEWYEATFSAKRAGAIVAPDTTKNGLRVANRNNVERQMLLANSRGYGGWSDDPISCNSTFSWTAQQVRAVLLPFRAGDVLSHLIAIVTSAPGTPANLTKGNLGVWDTSGTLLAYTDDCSTAFQSTGLKTVSVTQVWNGSAFITASAYAVTSDCVLYVGAWFDGTSMPTLLSRSTLSAAAAQPSNSFNTNPAFGAVAQSTQSAIPTSATFTVSSAGLFVGWN